MNVFLLFRCQIDNQKRILKIDRKDKKKVKEKKLLKSFDIV